MLRITDNYTLQTLCGAPHNVCNEEGKLLGMRQLLTRARSPQ